MRPRKFTCAATVQASTTTLCPHTMPRTRSNPIASRPPRVTARSSGDHLLAAAATVAAPSAFPERFEVFVAKEDFKFSSSHFVAFDGFRERIHGHNYSCSIRLRGEVSDVSVSVSVSVSISLLSLLLSRLPQHVFVSFIKLWGLEGRSGKSRREEGKERRRLLTCCHSVVLPYVCIYATRRMGVGLIR